MERKRGKNLALQQFLALKSFFLMLGRIRLKECISK